MTVKIFGHTVSTPAAVAIGGGSLVAVWFAYKQHQASASAASASSPSATDPVTGLPYSQDQVTDPLTGLTYLAEAQQYGSVAAAEQALSASSAANDTSGYAGYTGSSASSGTITTTPAGYATNAQWAQAVQAGLTGIGYTASDVSAALGLYLASLPETSAQAGIVDTALAEYGPPPVGSFTVILAAPTGPTGSGSTGTGTSTGTGSGTGTGTGSSGTTTAPVAVPDCAGQTTGAAHNTLTAAGFHPVAEAGQTDNLTCSGTNPPAGTQLAAGSSVTILASGVTVPVCKGMTAGQAHNALDAAGLHPVAATGQKATAICTGTSPAAGSQVNPGSNVTILT